MARFSIRTKAKPSTPSYSRFTWTESEADDIFSRAIKFNHNHVPAGSPEGGQFASADGDGGLPGVFNITGRGGVRGEVIKGNSLADHVIVGPDGKLALSPERQAIHQKIVDQFMQGAVKATGQPEMLMTGGGPAAGKTTVLKEGLVNAPAGAVSVNPDDIKDAMRPYDAKYDAMMAAHDPGAASYVHEESSMIAKELAGVAVDGRYNVILDTTGDTGADNLAKKIEPFRAAGYKINAVYATTSVDEALRRNELRFAETGRKVPEFYLRESHAGVSATVPDAVSRGLYDHLRVYDTTTRSPHLLASANGTALTVNDQAGYNAFLAKADGLPKTKAAGESYVPADRLAQLIVAIMAGTPKSSMNLKGREVAAWDTLSAECHSMRNAIVDPGDEMSGVDYSGLYTGRSIKFATTAGALDRNVQWVPIKKTDGEKQIVYGEVYAPYILDTYGEFMTPEDIEVMAHRFMQLDLSKVIDTQHDNRPNGSHPVESFIAREGDPDYTPGAWVLGVHIPDQELWQSVKSGLLNGFSFQSLVKPTNVDVEVDAIRDFLGETEVSEDHSHTFFVELDDIGNVVGGRTSEAPDGHYHEIQWASVTGRVNGHSHRFFL